MSGKWPKLIQKSSLILDVFMQKRKGRQMTSFTEHSFNRSFDSVLLETEVLRNLFFLNSEPCLLRTRFVVVVIARADSFHYICQSDSSCCFRIAAAPKVDKLYGG